MSADSDEPTRTPGLIQLGEDSDGRTMLAMPYSEELAKKAVERGLAQKTTTEPEPDDTKGDTPTPESGETDYSRRAGPVRRFNDVFTDLGSVQLEALGLDGQEIANATATLRNEMYRSQFPVVQPRFAVKCADEDCGAEYDRDMDFCLECARAEMSVDGVSPLPTDPDKVPEEYQDHPVRQPDPTEKREAERLAESINKEGQSLRGLMKIEEDDQSRIGVSVIVIKKTYAVAEGDTGVYDRGEVIWEDVDELVRGDPKRVVPVVDENGRVGGHWYACPIHRGSSRTGADDYEDGHTTCDDCGAELRDVFFAEMPAAGRYSRHDSPDKMYFQDEVVTWARYFPRLHGLDGLSPIHHIWLKQAILRWMDIYGAAYFDPDSERYPNKFMVVHTTNPKNWEKQFDKAEEDAKENPYSEQIMYNEYSGESNSTPEVQVIDLMSDDLLGQDQQLRDQYKQDIRTQFGVTNVFESDLKDAGGLNNEGLQMEVTDRTVASAMHDTVAGPLDELAKRLGIDDYIYEFVPPRDTDIDELRNNIEVGKKAANSGLDARLEDNQLEISDGEFEEGEEEEGGGLGGLLGAGEFDGGPESEKAVGDDPWSADVRLFRVVPSPDDEDNYDDGVLGVGVDFPESGCYVDWHREAFPDELEDPHVSEYGSVADLQKATGNNIVDVTRPPGAREKADPMINGHDLDPGTGEGVCESTGETIAAETMGDLAGDCPHCDEPLSVFGAEKADGAGGASPEYDWRTDGTDRTPAESADDGETERKRRGDDPVRFGNVGGDQFQTQEELEAFVGDLEEAGADVLLGDEPWEHAGGIHDRPVVAYGISLEDAEGVWEEHGDDAVALTGPKLEGEEGNDERRDGVDEEKLEAIKKLDGVFEHIVWADETTKAEPFWDDDEAVPDFVLGVIEDVVPDAVTEVDIESLPGAIGSRLIDVFKDSLTQPQGWSLRSITNNLQDEFGVPDADAELVARSETARIMNQAREEGYERAGALDEERLFKWIGPHDHRTTDACEWLKDKTEGGVTWERLIELQEEATDTFFPHLDFRKHVVHPNERHTFVETFKMDHPAADRVEVEYDYDWSPAVAGTFAAA